MHLGPNGATGAEDLAEEEAEIAACTVEMIGSDMILIEVAAAAEPPAQVYTPRTGGIPIPDAQVHAIEYARQKARISLELAMNSMSLDGSGVLPARPGHGTR
ncbi:hypothetical protein INS49_012504 [Diaporthe citri]|uniref:uncharacterized protein n=1 Tax=Diaporthe citri TaxID=83186 RepID=UPI001C808492|nr:uncharacterized protein INS49_012504 [Diaporthe citri]KAG6358984.1 hypothetical protein INS49_012504 [Diaporthe citri]